MFREPLSASVIPSPDYPKRADSLIEDSSTPVCDNVQAHLVGASAKKHGLI